MLNCAGNLVLGKIMRFEMNLTQNQLNYIVAPGSMVRKHICASACEYLMI